MAIRLEQYETTVFSTTVFTKPSTHPKNWIPVPLIQRPVAILKTTSHYSALQGSGSPRERVPRELHSLGQPKKLFGLSDSNQGGHQAFLGKGRAPAAIWNDLHKSKQGSLLRHTPSSPSLLGIRPP